MSKYIDADLYVEMQIYDDEHEEWGWWKGTIEDLLDQWTEEGCPTPIEVSEDAVSREDTIRWVKTECNPYGKPTLDYDSGRKVIEHLKKMPSVIPTHTNAIQHVESVESVEKAKEGEWIISADGESSCSVCGASEEEFIYGTENWYGMGDSVYCPSCGAKMKGAEE